MNWAIWFWYNIMPYLAIILPGLAIGIFTFWYKRLPSAVRTLYKAARKGLIPILLTHDSGRSRIVLAQERRGEGVVITEDGRYKVLPRFVSEEGKPANPHPDPVKAWFAEWSNKRSFLTGLNLPFYIGYSGTVCLMSPMALAMVEGGDMQVPTVGEPIKVTPKDPKKVKVHELQEPIKPLLILDPRQAKEIINDQYDDSEIAAIVRDAERLGETGRPSFFSKHAGLIMLLVIIGIGAAAFVFLPDILARMG